MGHKALKLLISDRSDHDLLVLMARQPPAEVKTAICEELYERHFNFVRGVISGYNRPRGNVEIEDVLDEVFLTFFRRLDKKDLTAEIADPDKTTSYVRSILRNLVKDNIRAVFRKWGPRAKEVKLDEKGWAMIAATRPEEKTTAENESEHKFTEHALAFIRSTLEKSLAGRDEKYRDVLASRLVAYPQPTFKQIARRLKITEAACRQRYKRAVLKFRDVLAQEADNEMGKGKWDDQMLQELLRRLNI